MTTITPMKNSFRTHERPSSVPSVTGVEMVACSFFPESEAAVSDDEGEETEGGDIGDVLSRLSPGFAGSAAP